MHAGAWRGWRRQSRARHVVIKQRTTGLHNKSPLLEPKVQPGKRLRCFLSSLLPRNYFLRAADSSTGRFLLSPAGLQPLAATPPERPASPRSSCCGAGLQRRVRRVRLEPPGKAASVASSRRAPCVMAQRTQGAHWVAVSFNRLTHQRVYRALLSNTMRRS